MRIRIGIALLALAGGAHAQTLDLCELVPEQGQIRLTSPLFFSDGTEQLATALTRVNARPQRAPGAPAKPEVTGCVIADVTIGTRAPLAFRTSFQGEPKASVQVAAFDSGVNGGCRTAVMSNTGCFQTGGVTLTGPGTAQGDDSIVFEAARTHVVATLQLVPEL